MDLTINGRIVHSTGETGRAVNSCCRRSSRGGGGGGDTAAAAAAAGRKEVAVGGVAGAAGRDCVRKKKNAMSDQLGSGDNLAYRK